MGIIRFFSTVINKYPDILQKNASYDLILLDFNSIIHDSFATIAQQTSPDNIKQRIFEEVVNKTTVITRGFKEVHIFIDGVPTIAKMMEQKHRRLFGELVRRGREMILERYKDRLTPEEYRFEKEVVPQIVLSRSHIAPQTDFMRQLVAFLKKNITATFHDDTEPGEAEHKIVAYLKSAKPANASVYSPDADMFILLLKLSDRTSFNLVRKDIHSKDYVDISIDSLKKRLGGSHAHITDLCFVYNVFGNDFIPEIDIIDIKHNFDKVMDIYQSVSHKHGRIVTDAGVNWKVLGELYRRMAQHFTRPVVKKVRKFRPSSNDYYDHVYDWMNFKNRYATNNHFPKDTPSITDYLLTLRFIYQLYEGQSTKLLRYWHYPHKSAPTLRQIADFIEKHRDIDGLLDAAEERFLSQDIRFKEVTPLQQLLYITPTADTVREIVDVDAGMLKKAGTQFRLNEEFLSKLRWENGLLNANSIVKCGNHLYLNKCYPNVNVVEDPIHFFNKLSSK